MNTNNQNHKSNKTTHLNDVSGYTRWINHWNTKDKEPDGVGRKYSWLFFVGILLLAFVLSFLLFPGSKLNYTTITSPESSFYSDTAKQNKRVYRSLDMPADSFEQLLKHKINENIPKEK